MIRVLHGFSFVFQELGFFVMGLKVSAPYVQVVAICVLQRSIMVSFLTFCESDDCTSVSPAPVFRCVLHIVPEPHHPVNKP
jgi:hypothetical protein